jgi:hypothetical protein
MTTNASNSRPGAKRSDKRPDAQPFFERLEKSLVKYVVDATAAGVGLLALATPASADTISQSVRINIPLPHPIGVSGSSPHWRARPDQGPNSTLQVPFGSHFSFKASQRCSSSPMGNFPTVTGKILNIRGKAASDQLIIGPLKKGSAIGPGDAFVRQGVLASTILHTAFGGCGAGFPFPGGWRGTGYMGFEFDISGEPHFGWAQLTVLSIHGVTVDSEFYNPVANQGIPAGETTSIPEPATLGLLALGFFGLGMWRKRQAARRS